MFFIFPQGIKINFYYFLQDGFLQNLQERRDNPLHPCKVYALRNKLDLQQRRGLLCGEDFA